MLILLEGADGVGKTTLSNALAARLGQSGAEVEQVAYGPPRGHPLAEYGLGLEKLRRHVGYGSSAVIDRLHWSQEVYGPRYRGRSDLLPEGALYVDLMLRAMGAVVVHLTDAPDDLMRRLRERGLDEYGPVDDVPFLVDRYWQLARASSLPVLSYPFGEADLGEIVDAAIQGVAGTAIRGFPRYVGSPTPAALLVGDRRPQTGRRCDDHETPFAPYPDCSGYFLLRSLGVPYREGDVGLVNARELEPDAMRRLWGTLGQPRLVALGREAEEALLEAGFELNDFGAVPHPAYMRRFHHFKRQLYGRLIDEAARLGRRTYSLSNHP